MANSSNKYFIVVSFFVFLCFLSILSGTSDLACSSLGADIPCNSVCVNYTSKYLVSNKIHLNASVYMAGNKSASDIATSCSCDIVISPAPRNLTIQYRTSDKHGCLLFYKEYIETQECMIQTMILTETNSELLFSKASEGKYVCFGIDFGHLYNDDNQSSITVSCHPDEYTLLSAEQTNDDLNLTTQLTSSSVTGNGSISNMTLTYSVTVARKRFEPSSTSTYDITTGTFVGLACGGGLLLATAALVFLLFCRFRQKRRCRQGHARNNAAAQTLNTPDNELIVTDNLLYDLTDLQHEAQSVSCIQGENTIDNENIETDNLNNIEPKIEGIGFSKAENMGLKELSDEDKIKLYANNRIRKKKSLVETNDSLYSNDSQSYNRHQ